MTTLDMEIAVMKHFGIVQSLIVPNVSWGISGLHECDILSLSKAGYATEIEIKISKADLRADKKKSHGHRHGHIARLYFAVPSFLKQIALEEIPERAGLLVAVMDKQTSENIIRLQEEKPCKRNSGAHQWTDLERSKLGRLGAIRILGLKEIISTYIKNRS